MIRYSFQQTSPSQPGQAPSSTQVSGTPPVWKPAGTFAENASMVLDLLRTRPAIRVVNYHNASRARIDHYDQELQQYSREFSSVNEAELRDYLKTGRWTKPKPGMMPVAYEGYRNGLDVLAPLFEKHGFVGWYFIITEFIKAPIAEQEAYAKGHRIGMRSHDYADGRYALTWDEIRQLSQKHVIACHARNHIELSAQTEEVREREIMGSQEDFRQYFGRPVTAFASLRGPAHLEHPEIDTNQLVERAGFEFVFSNFRIQRVGKGREHAGA